MCVARKLHAEGMLSRKEGLGLEILKDELRKAWRKVDVLVTYASPRLTQVLRGDGIFHISVSFQYGDKSANSCFSSALLKTIPPAAST